MPFSESLAARIRDTLVHKGGIAEQKMFGGLCFLLRGNILVGVRKDSLIARLGELEATKALKKSYVTQMGTRHPMKGWVIIGVDGIDTDRQLASWIEKAIEFVEALPGK
jgi:TfoX/Sxy family transcriptional regulator of competence genes